MSAQGNASNNNTQAHSPSSQSSSPNSQSYSAAQPAQQDGHQTLPPCGYPYRPRPSSTPSGNRNYTFCEHGVAFDCGYGCHANANSPHALPPQRSPSFHSSPSPSHPGTPNSSSSPTPPGNAPGSPVYATLPSRMAPGPGIMNVSDPKFTSPDPTDFATKPDIHVPPSGQARRANLPCRMAPDPSAASSPDAV